MRLTCFATSGDPPELRPAPADRAWMEATPLGYARRCLPLMIANAHGWEALSPCAFKAVWNGGIEKDCIKIKAEGAHAPISHFGSGVLTFHLTGLFQTDPGINLFVTGPVNRPKDGISPLSGIVETDWCPYTFTMNWIFTRAQHPVFFAKGEPFCFFFPIPRNLIETVEPEIRTDIPADFATWSASRNKFNHDLGVPGSTAQAEKWQKIYHRGQRPGGEQGTGDHQVKLRLRPFVHG